MSESDDSSVEDDNLDQMIKTNDIFDEFCNDINVERMISYKGIKVYEVNQDTIDKKHGQITIEALWEELENEFNLKSMPYRFIFALIMCSEPSDNLVDIRDQWSYFDKTDGFVEDQELAEQSQCICSHVIYEVYWIKNNKNKNLLAVGNDCIKKFGNDQLKGAVEIAHKHKKYLKSGGNKKQCLGCGNHKISAKKSWQNLCKKCFSSGSMKLKVSPKNLATDNVPCPKCKEYKIANRDKDWKKLCNDCYKQTPALSNDKVPCPNCKKYKILEKDKHWKKLCGDCYRKTQF